MILVAKSNVKTVFLLFILHSPALFVNYVYAGNDNWRLQIDDRKQDIILHYRNTPDGLIEFRGVTHIKSSLSAFVALFRDVEAMPRWVDHAYKSVNLKQVSDTEVFAYMITSMPLLFSYRHVVVHTHISQDPESGNVLITGRDAQPGYLQELSEEMRDFLAKQEDYVSIRNLKSHWAFRPKGDGMVEVEFQGYGDPGGSLSTFFPKWLIRMFIWEAPYNTLKNMHKIVRKQKYQSSRYSFIREPEEIPLAE